VAGHGPGHKRLARSRRSVQEDALGLIDTRRFNQRMDV